MTGELARERLELWPPGEAGAAVDWAPGPGDVLFLAGVDWRYLAGAGLEALPNPRINLIQHVRHAHEGSELYGYLAYKAIRVCVSREVADAIRGTGRVNGPVVAIPNGVEMLSVRPCGGVAEAARRSVVIAGYKEPQLAKAVAAGLAAANLEHLALTEFRARREFLELLGGSRVAICLPRG